MLSNNHPFSASLKTKSLKSTPHSAFSNSCLWISSKTQSNQAFVYTITTKFLLFQLLRHPHYKSNGPFPVIILFELEWHLRQIEKSLPEILASVNFYKLTDAWLSPGFTHYCLLFSFSGSFCSPQTLSV